MQTNGEPIRLAVGIANALRVAEKFAMVPIPFDDRFGLWQIRKETRLSPVA
jgi:hypothetical protein